jgi:hypothetical protein
MTLAERRASSARGPGAGRGERVVCCRRWQTPQAVIAWVPTAVPTPSHGRGSTRLGIVLLLFTLAALSAGAAAQDLEPRAYVNTPVGLNRSYWIPGVLCSKHCPRSTTPF